MTELTGKEMKNVSEINISFQTNKRKNNSLMVNILYRLLKEVLLAKDGNLELHKSLERKQI